MNANEILEMMRKGMGEVPAAIEKSVPFDPALVQEHVRSKHLRCQRNSRHSTETPGR